jgi:CubicO group peptidase (beta-lactamase class C family)
VSAVVSSGSQVHGATGDVQPVTPSETSTRTVLGASEQARRTADDLLGDRPFQVVLMSNQRPVMTASSRGSSPFTDVPVASISKLVTSLTVMRLIDMGQLSLSDTLGAFYSPTLVPERWRAVTIQQLLSHTSGFAADRDRWFNDTYSSCWDAFRRTVERDAPQASGYEYSNTNFCALSLVIGAVSKPSYEDAAYRLLLRPLGIDRKVMDAEYANLAGAGGWRMSALDIARVVSALDPQARLSPVSSSTRTQMIQQTTYNYGLGVWIWDADTFGHSGSLYRARNIAVRLPSGRVAVIMTQATFPESGLDLLPIAQRIDAAYTESCAEEPCTFVGLDPFSDMPSGVRGMQSL